MNRVRTAISLLALTPAGLCAKFYRGPGAAWVNNSLAGALYVIFWCLVVSLLAHRARPIVVAACVLTATCVLEFLQLWHPPFLEYLRGYFVGRTILGSQFAWSDFPYYLLGSAIGYAWMRWVLLHIPFTPPPPPSPMRRPGN